MASNSETGNAKNVANFGTLTSFCAGYGADYNPVKASIQLPALTALKPIAENAIKAVTINNTTFMNSTNVRQIIFDPLKPLATRIVSAFASTDASKEAIDDAKTINRKIQGSRKGGSTTAPAPTPPITPPAPTDITPPNDNQISVSQQSYDSIVENFFKLIEMIKSEPTYMPNEADLKVAALEALQADMLAKNKAVVDAATDLSNSRIARNKILYADKTGLYDIAMEVKIYIKSVYGATSPQYKQVSGIKFTKPKQ